MITARSTLARTLIGIALLAVATCALAWFASHFAPGEPRTPEPDTKTGWNQASGSSRLDAERIVDVPLGETLHADGLTFGKSFSSSEEEIASWSDEERERITGSDSWRYDVPALDFTVVDCRALSDDAFIAWYPHYGDARTKPDRAEAKVVLVDLSVTNPAEEPVAFPTAFQLWSEDLVGASDKLGSGIAQDTYLLEELYGEPQGQIVEYGLPDGWNGIEPGETRTFTCAYLVYKNAFADPNGFDDFDPSRFCLAIADYDPPTVYRLWLG